MEPQESGAAPDAAAPARPSVGDAFSEYRERLYRYAVVKLGANSQKHTLGPTALVNDALLVLARRANSQGAVRSVLSYLRATMKNRFLNYLRGKRAQKRDGNWKRVPLSEDIAHDSVLDPAAVASVNEALAYLGRLDPEASRVAECMITCDLNVHRVAKQLGISKALVKDKWAFAKAMLSAYLKGDTS